MSTRSLIGVKQPDETIKYVYCHFDGYPEGVGKMLMQHYNSLERANAIIALGGISYLEPKLEPDTELAPCANPYYGGEVRHSFETPHKGVTVAYHRDRGEGLCIDECFSEKHYWHTADWDYKYLFKEGRWFVDGCDLAKVLTETNK